MRHEEIGCDEGPVSPPDLVVNLHKPHSRTNHSFSNRCRISTDNVEDILTKSSTPLRLALIPNRFSPPLVGASG